MSIPPVDRYLARPYVEARISDAEHRYEMRRLEPLRQQPLSASEVRVIGLGDSAASVVMVGTPRKCTACGVEASTFINRGGTTKCLACDQALAEIPY